MKKLRCRECPTDTTIVLDHTSGDTICTECGLVLEQNYIDDTPEWRSFEESAHNPVRVGQASNPLLDDAGLSTSIKLSTTGSDKNKGLGASWHKHKGTASSQNLVEAFKDIEALAGRLNLNKVIRDQANEIFMRATEAKLARGVDQIAKVAACIYLACQQLNVPRTYKEMEHAAPKAKLKSIGRATKQIQGGLQEEHQELMKKAIMKPEDLVRRFASQLGLESSDSRAVQEIVKSCYIHIMDVRRTPKSVVAAVIYMAMRIQNKGEKPLEILEEAVAKATDTSLSTLKGTYKQLSPWAEKIVPSWYADEEEMKYLIG